MKPAAFEYLAPDTLGAALAAVAAHGDSGKVLAGGQSLIPVMNFRLAQPEILIDLNGVRELDFVRRENGELRIGAMTRQRRLERDPEIARAAPLLAEAVPWIAHPQIRNRGTIGGSLAHADPSAELPAVALALGARFRLQSGRGERWVEAADFFTGLFSTVLEPDELLVEIAIPETRPRTGWSFLEVARRHGDYALVGIAARVELDAAGSCREARCVFLSVGDGPVQARQAQAALAGRTLATAAVEDAAALAGGRDIEPHGDIHASAAFKRHLAKVLFRRAVETAAERARSAA
jgi:CO/xanthine dehydrogenase FAD-binding subunit